MCTDQDGVEVMVTLKYQNLCILSISAVPIVKTGGFALSFFLLERVMYLLFCPLKFKCLLSDHSLIKF